MKKGNRSAATAAGHKPKDAGRIARAINWRVCHDRSKRDTAAREKHLRSLMGLPAAAPRQLDECSE